MKEMIVFLVVIIVIAAIAAAWMLIAGAAPGKAERKVSDEEQMKACHSMNEAHKKKSSLGNK